MNSKPNRIPFKPILAALVAVLMLAACGPSIQVRSDSAPGVDLAQFKTFNFFQQLGIEGSDYSSLLGQHFRDAIFAQMQSRGFSLTTDPQLQINVSADTEDKIRVNSYSEPYLYGGYYGRPGWGYWGSPWGYAGATTTTVSQYTKAYIYIDVVDAAEHKLLWQGVATFTLTDKMQDNVRAAVNQTVNEIFTQFPVPATTTSP